MLAFIFLDLGESEVPLFSFFLYFPEEVLTFAQELFIFLVPRPVKNTGNIVGIACTDEPGFQNICLAVILQYVARYFGEYGNMLIRQGQDPHGLADVHRTGFFQFPPCANPYTGRPLW